MASFQRAVTNVLYFLFLSRFIGSKTHVLIDVSSGILLTMAITLLFVNEYDNTIRIQKKGSHSVWISSDVLYCCVNFEMAYILTINYFF